jgi:hypothetical protein
LGEQIFLATSARATTIASDREAENKKPRAEFDAGLRMKERA